jgi:hypothetical protein
MRLGAVWAMLALNAVPLAPASAPKISVPALGGETIVDSRSLDLKTVIVANGCAGAEDPKSQEAHALRSLVRQITVTANGAATVHYVSVTDLQTKSTGSGAPATVTIDRSFAAAPGETGGYTISNVDGSPIAEDDGKRVAKDVSALIGWRRLVEAANTATTEGHQTWSVDGALIDAVFDISGNAGKTIGVLAQASSATEAQFELRGLDGAIGGALFVGKSFSGTLTFGLVAPSLKLAVALSGQQNSPVSYEGEPGRCIRSSGDLVFTREAK